MSMCSSYSLTICSFVSMACTLLAYITPDWLINSENPSESSGLISYCESGEGCLLYQPGDRKKPILAALVGGFATIVSFLVFLKQANQSVRNPQERHAYHFTDIAMLVWIMFVFAGFLCQSTLYLVWQWDPYPRCYFGFSFYLFLVGTVITSATPFIIPFIVRRD